MRRSALAFVCLALGGSAFAQEVKVMTALDFMVDWPKLVRQRVQITGGRVWGAQEDHAFLSVPGGDVYLASPWTDREDRTAPPL
jgi:hypothetical protein